MKTSPFLLVVTAGVILGMTGCTHKPYHPTKPDRLWASDHADCEMSVRAEIRDEPPATYDAYDEMKLIKACMKAKGWRWERTSWFKPRKASDE
ncbi:hypothetical protein DSCO28_26490 [Desulfosarcina ovata subsp. sediminis]|uniref:Lipoprotein n=1 Tax=Desulfosarcina ovata subsp. sediminis TaxID=885957 RepID=A0A5K7ZRL9_9BACT|nr:hypothetical protein [Desulfosarcina ovata]BBO82083.1 hypothetical protein DSCO28_26490 [Desulfosarcina ovata subsp. sediminis]